MITISKDYVSCRVCRRVFSRVCRRVFSLGNQQDFDGFQVDMMHWRHCYGIKWNNTSQFLCFFFFCSVQTFKGYQWNLCSHYFSSLIYRDSNTPNQWNLCSYCFLFVSIETQVDVSEEIKRINQTAEPLLSLFSKCFLM